MVLNYLHTHTPLPEKSIFSISLTNASSNASFGCEVLAVILEEFNHKKD